MQKPRMATAAAAVTHLQAQHQWPEVAHCNRRLAGEANEIILAHGRKLSVVSAACVTQAVWGLLFVCGFVRAGGCAHVI
jgi:hypothetical protein